MYSGSNTVIEHAMGDVIVPVNSDHMFFAGWLTDLARHWTPGKVLSPVTFEPNKVRFPATNGTGALLGEFGKHPKEFDVDAFKSACEKNAEEGKLTRGGVYMPCMMLKQVVVDHGMFRPGNIKRNKSHWARTGYPADANLFQDLRRSGIEHQTCWTSFCYHFQEGEMRE